MNEFNSYHGVFVDYKNINEAIEALKKVAEGANESKRAVENQAKIISINSRIAWVEDEVMNDDE